MAKHKPRLLLDLTPLATPGGARGIGRYVRELACGIATLGPIEDIDLMGLTSLDWTGNYEVTTDFAGFLESRGTELHSGTDYYSWAYRQRANTT